MIWRCPLVSQRIVHQCHCPAFLAARPITGFHDDICIFYVSFNPYPEAPRYGEFANCKLHTHSSPSITCSATPPPPHLHSLFLLKSITIHPGTAVTGLIPPALLIPVIAYLWHQAKASASSSLLIMLHMLV